MVKINASKRRVGKDESGIPPLLLIQNVFYVEIIGNRNNPNFEFTPPPPCRGALTKMFSTWKSLEIEITQF
jgi:hypothetical protein